MSGPNFVVDKAYTIAAATSQYYLVKFSASETVTPVTAVSDQPVGVCLEAVSAADATAGRQANIRMMGIARCVAGGAISRGALVRPTTAGKVQALAGTAGTNEVVVGIALETVTTDGDQIDILLTPGARSNTAVS